MKTIFFEEINLFNIFIIFFFKLLGFKILFIKIDKNLRKKKIIKFLEIFNVKWFNYQNYDFKKPNSNIVVPADNFTDEFSKKITDLIWDENIKKISDEKQNLDICVQQRFMDRFRNLYEIFSVAKHFADEKNKIYIWISNDLLSKQVMTEDKKVVNLYPKIFTLFNDLLFYSFKFFYEFLIIKFLKRMFYYLQFKKIVNIKQINQINANDFKVCFFPHKGPIGINYKKNYFYSKDKNDFFYFSNILHFEWSQADIKNSKENLNFYKQNKIKVLFWDTIKNEINFINYKFIFIFFRIFLNLFIKLGIIGAIEILIILFRIEQNKKKLSKFPNLKLALVGYDWLFPQTLAVACRMKKITLVAAQERVIEPARKSQYMLDKYFVIGNHSKKMLEERKDKKMELIEMGLVKMKQHFEEGKEVKILNGNSYKFKCLVMDWHSVEDWYDNGRLFNANWKANLNFYKIILHLAKNNKDVLFLIKSKNYLWLKINFFEEIVNDFKKIENVEILSDQEKWTPSNCIKSTDFGIGLMTSLADEMLIVNKPVIIFESEDFPSCYLDYGSDIISKSFEDLNAKVQKIKSGLKFYNDKLNSVRVKFYKQFNIEKFSAELTKLSLNL